MPNYNPNTLTQLQGTPIQANYTDCPPPDLQDNPECYHVSYQKHKPHIPVTKMLPKVCEISHRQGGGTLLSHVCGDSGPHIFLHYPLLPVGSAHAN